MNETEPAKREPIVGTLNAVLPDLTVQARAATRANLASYHLQAAVCFARQAHDIESRNYGRPFDNAFTPIFWHASSSVIMSATALEARINEMIKDVMDDKSLSAEIAAPYDKLIRKPVARLPGESELVAKYKQFATLRGTSVDESLALYSSLVALIRFRNALVHFKPEWDSENGLQKDTSEVLAGKFNVMPNIAFPLSHLTYSSAKWAVGTTRKFAAHYANLIGVPDQLAAPWLDLELP